MKAAELLFERDGFKVRKLPGRGGIIIDPGGVVVSGLRAANKWLDSQPIGVVRAAVNKAHRAVWGRNVEADTMANAVRHPNDTRRAGEEGIGRAVAVIFTEYGNLSQYGNDDFWIGLEKALEPAGLYYEWYDGGTATIWPIDPPSKG
ncbi:MAG: hypothetical protein EPN91_06960 [Salinibacterium sp.]|nr:MAG: hypothetical protein EPN91_06960 [Salinibacterium sp.]